MSQHARFSIIPGWIVTDPRLKGKDLQVLCLLGRHTDKQGWCRRSQVKMAKQLGCARSTVQASLDRLGEMGAVEKHAEYSSDGSDSAHSYRVIYDTPPPFGYAFDAWEQSEQEDKFPHEAATDELTPAGIPAPPAGLESAPPAGPESAPINDPYLTTPAKREEREARERGHSGLEGHGAANVVNADLIKRVQKFCTGDGYREGEWPKWATSTIGHIAKQFAQLDHDERDRACEWRDAFLAKCKRDRVTRPMPVANYFRDKVWLMLTDADKVAVRPVAGGAPVASNGRCVVPVFGPAFGAARAWALLAGPVDVVLPDDVRERMQATYEVYARRGPHAAQQFLIKHGLSEQDGRLIFPDDFEGQERARRVITEGYPEVKRLHDAATSRGNVTVAPIFEHLKGLCEAVKVGSEIWERWQVEHERRGWQFVPTPGNLPVVYFPKGGPEGLEEFERAARSIMAARDEDDAA